MLFGQTWNVTAAEAAGRFACDALVPAPAEHLTRALDVEAPPAAVWPWFAQLRVAPYSYDWIDNRGRRSPRRLDRSRGEIEVGEPILSIFVVTEVRPGAEFTARVRGGGPGSLFGAVATTYRVVPRRGGGSRMVVRMTAGRGRGPRRLFTELLGPGDLVMMRKQLHTLAQLAERDA